MQIETVKTAYRRYAGFYDAIFGPVLQPGRKVVLESLSLRPGDRVRIAITGLGELANPVELVDTTGQPGR